MKKVLIGCGGLAALAVIGVMLVAVRMASDPEYAATVRRDATERERQSRADSEARTALDRQQKKARIEEAVRMDAERHPERQMSVKIVGGWNAGGFGTVMIATLRLENRNPFPVKDIAVECTTYGNSGTALGNPSKTLYEVIPANGNRTFKDVNLGFIRDQAERAGCKAKSAVKAD